MQQKRRLRQSGEVTKLLGISHPTLYRLVKQGELRAYRIGSQLRFNIDDVERYLELANTEGNSNAINNDQK